MSWFYLYWVDCTYAEIVVLLKSWFACTHEWNVLMNWLHVLMSWTYLYMYLWIGCTHELVALMKRVDRSYDQFKCVNKDRNIFAGFLVILRMKPLLLLHSAHCTFLTFIFIFLDNHIFVYLFINFIQLYLCKLIYLTFYLTTYSTEELFI